MRTELAIWSFAALASLSVLAHFADEARTASRARDKGLAALRTTRAHLETFRSLQSAVPIDPRGSSARSGLATRVTGVLNRAGLSAGVLANFSPEGDVVVGSAGDIRVTRGRATISLAVLSLAQTGSFLKAWREAEPKWVPTSIDLSPALARGPEAGGDLPLRVVIVIESLHVIRNGDGLD